MLHETKASKFCIKRKRERDTKSFIQAKLPAKVFYYFRYKWKNFDKGG